MKMSQATLQVSETVQREEGGIIASEASSDKVKLNLGAGRDSIKTLSEAQSPKETTTVGQTPISGLVREDLVKPLSIEKLDMLQIDSLRISVHPHCLLQSLE